MADSQYSTQNLDLFMVCLSVLSRASYPQQHPTILSQLHMHPSMKPVCMHQDWLETTCNTESLKVIDGDCSGLFR